MAAESRKRGREQETMTERLESERVAKKVDKDGYYRGGKREEEEEEKEMGVFEFPWLKGREGVMTEEEWKEAGVVLGETFLGTLGRCCREREEEEVVVDMTSTSTSSSCSSTTLSLGEGVSLSLSMNLEEWWDDRDGIWGDPSLLH